MKRNKKAEKLKYFRSLYRKRKELWYIEPENLELKEPYQRGWDINVSLRDDILRREDSQFLLKLVKLGIDGKFYTRYVEDIKKIRKGDFNGMTINNKYPGYSTTYRQFIPGRKAFRESRYNKFSDRVKKYFYFDGKYYRLNLPSYYFILKVKPHIITHQYLPNPEVESELAKVQNKCHKLDIRTKLHGRRDTVWHWECYAYKRAKIKVKTNKLIQDYYDTMEEWEITDPSCNQMMLQLSENVFQFKEDRVINLVTKETELYESTIDLKDYTQEEMYSDVKPFGYSFNEMCTWIDKGKNLALIAECIFEMGN